MLVTLPSVLITAALLPFVACQDLLPSDLAENIDLATTELQVSYTGDGSEGFDDGTRLTPEETKNLPKFALGNSSGIGTLNNFWIAMVDITCDSARILHYIQTEFRNTGDKTLLGSDTEAAVAYEAPGAFGEKGDRKYGFLLWRPGKDKQIDGLPVKGAPFDIQAFQELNSLEDPEAALTMLVDLGGDINCAAGDPPADPPADSPADPPAEAPNAESKPAEAPNAEDEPADNKDQRNEDVKEENKEDKKEDKKGEEKDIIKAELRKELKEELKKELIEELKNELKAEVTAQLDAEFEGVPTEASDYKVLWKSSHWKLAQHAEPTLHRRDDYGNASSALASNLYRAGIFSIFASVAACYLF